MEPILVPSMCLLIREATRVAVVGRWERVAAHWRAYSPTVTGFASPMYAPDNLAPLTARQVPPRVSFAGECPASLAAISRPARGTGDRLALNVLMRQPTAADIYMSRL